MKVLHQDAKQHLIKLVPEIPDDLWHLMNLLRPGDRVGTLTFRTPDIKDEKLRSGKLEKQKMYLILEVTEVEYAEFSDRLRILGTIVEGPQDLGSHHTFNIEADSRTELTITKPDDWNPRDLARVKEAVEAAKRPVMHILAIEEGEAVLAEVRQAGVREVATIQMGGGGKQYAERTAKSEDPRIAFYDEILEKLIQARREGQPLIVVGPGFAREHLIERGKQDHPDAVQGALTEGTGQAGMVGVHEAIKRGLVARVQQEAQVAQDTQRIQRLLEEIARDGLATYGPQQVARAVKAGAVETVLVTEEQVRDRTVEKLLAQAEQTGAEVHVVAVGHDAGRTLKGLGGLAALLRYKLEP